MHRQKRTKFIHAGNYAAEVEVELIEEQAGWSPCLSLEDACKLDEVYAALKQGDVKKAAQFGKVYELHPLAV
ncbi:MAG: hypothetical protein ACOCVG_01025 [Verrucomicrobiota bacterium]